MYTLDTVVTNTMSPQKTVYITVLLIILFTGCTQASLLKFQGKFEADFEDFVDVKIQNNGRYRRSPGDQSPYPHNVDVIFTAFSDDVSLPLTRNDDVDQNVPVYIARDSGITRQHVPVLQNVALYQNLEKGAAFMVEFNDTHIHNIFGSLHLHNEEYFIEQTNQTRPFKEPTNQNQLYQHQSKLYKMFKTKQRDLKYDFILEDGQTGLQNMRRKFDHNLGGHGRNKRAITANQVELLIATDYSVYQYWYDESTATTTSEKDIEAKTSVRQFYAFVMNAIDVRYKSIISSSISISVVFAGIYISDSFAASTWTEDRVAVGSKFTVDISNVLTKFRTWEQATSGLPSHDHAMMFTKYDFTDDNDGGVAGLAYLNGICGTIKQSVVEDLFDFGMMTIAAHELGHNLGASHDGEGNTCSLSDGFVMAATSVIQTGATATHPWQFSSCSVTSFENKINSLNNAGSNCLTTLSPEFDPTALTPYDQVIAGQMFDADAQCRHIVGDNSYMCRGFYYQNYDSICNRMYCSRADGSGFCSEHVPAEGTSCGKNKWCVEGECVSNASAPSVSDTCPFGDQAGVISSGHTCASVVQLNAYNCNTTSWYSYCCSTCGALYTGIPGCEYGDKSSQCNAADCPFYSAANLDICCGSCAVTTTTTTTKTTTTTPTTTTTTPTTTTTTPTTTTTTPTTTTTIPTTTTTTPTTTTTTPTTTTTIPTTTTTTSTTTTTTPTTTTTTPATTTNTPTTTITTPTTTTTTPTTTTTTPTTTTTTSTTTTTTPTTTTTIPTTTTTTPTTTTTTPTTTTTTPTTTSTTPTTTTTAPTTTTTTPTTSTTTPTTTTQTTSTTPTTTSTPTTATTTTTTTTTTPTTTATTPTTTTTTTPTTTTTSTTTTSTTMIATSATTNRSTTSTPTSTITIVPVTTATNNTTTTTDELMKMLIIGVSVGVAGLLLIILIAVAVCLICRTVNRKKPARGGSDSPSVDSTYIPDMYHGKSQRSPAPTPVMFNSSYMSEVTPSPSVQSRNGRAQIPTTYSSRVSSPQTQKWYPLYGYTNHGLQIDSAMDNYTDPTMSRQPYTDFDIRGHPH